jgi:polysaccharide export outer membrane protein
MMVLVLAAALCAGGCQTGTYSSQKALQARLLTMAKNPPVEDEYEIAPPDTLSIEVKGYPEYSRQVTVRPDGRITVSSIGDVDVQGLTTLEAAEAIRTELLKELSQPTVTVTLLVANSKAIHVMGEVRRPGRQPYFGDMTLVDAIGSAGGITLNADVGVITITRASLQEPDVLVINLRKLVYKGQEEQNIVLEEGDIIHVPPTAFAKVGYAMNQLLFPFRAVLGTMVTYHQVDEAVNDDD